MPFSDRVANPTMTICNANRIRRSKAIEYGLDDELLAYLFDEPLLQHMAVYPWTEEGQKELAAKRFAQWRKARGFESTRHVYEVLGHQCNDTVIAVSKPDFGAFGKVPCSRQRLPGVTHVSPVMTTKYGLCHRLVLADGVNFNPPGRTWC